MSTEMTTLVETAMARVRSLGSREEVLEMADTVFRMPVGRFSKLARADMLGMFMGCGIELPATVRELVLPADGNLTGGLPKDNLDKVRKAWDTGFAKAQMGTRPPPASTNTVAPAGAAAAARAELKACPMTFGGLETEDVHAWRRIFEDYVRGKGYDLAGKEALACLRLSLRGVAQTWAAYEPGDTASDLLAALTTRYDRRKPESVAKREMRMLRRRTTESRSEFAFRVQSEARLRLERVVERELLEWIVEGLQDDRLAERHLLGDFDSFAQLLAAIRTMDAAQQLVTPTTAATRGKTTLAAEAVETTLAVGGERREVDTGRGGSGQRGRDGGGGSNDTPKRCTYCGYRGHDIADCRGKKHDEKLQAAAAAAATAAVAKMMATIPAAPAMPAPAAQPKNA